MISVFKCQARAHRKLLLYRHLTEKPKSVLTILHIGEEGYILTTSDHNTAMAVLPPELIREVIRHLTKKDDMKTLRAASLVSPSFRGPCQEKAFAHLQIVHRCRNICSNKGYNGKGFELLRHNNSLLPYVKAVTVAESHSEYDSTSSLLLDPAMARLMLLLSTLR